MKRPQQGQASGFAEGRAAASGKIKKKDAPQNRTERAAARVNKARDELASILSEDADLPKPVGKSAEKSATRFGDEIQKVRRLVGNSNDDFNAESANRHLLRAILATTLDLIPRAEKNYRREGKEQQGYVYVALCNQAKELAIDLKMMSDTENQSRFISESILHPIFIALTQTMMQELMSVKTVVDTLVDDRRAGQKLKTRIDDGMRTMGEFMTGASIKTSANIQSYLGGDMSFLGAGEAGEPPKKKRRRK